MMGEKVAGAVVRERGRVIRAIGQGLTTRFRDSQVGTVHRGLTLEDGTLVVTGNYLKVRIPAGRARNEWVRVRVASHDHGELLGGGPTGPLHDQLTTGGADVAPAALPDRHDQPVIGEDLREPVHGLV